MRRYPLTAVVAILSALSAFSETTRTNTGDQTQAFLFGYTNSNLVLPVVDTCPTPMLITKMNPTNAGGPDPASPYTMIAFVHEQLQDGSGATYERIYAKNLSMGDMSKDQLLWHPWGSGTQFIGCIWAVSGFPTWFRLLMPCSGVDADVSLTKSAVAVRT